MGVVGVGRGRRGRARWMGRGVEVRWTYWYPCKKRWNFEGLVFDEDCLE